MFSDNKISNNNNKNISINGGVCSYLVL